MKMAIGRERSTAKPTAKMDESRPSGKRMKSLAILVLGTLFISIAQLLIKIGAGKISLNAFGLVTNYALILGFAFYGISAIIFILALKELELSVAYPVISLSFVWVTILSIIFLGEKSTLGSLAGIILVIIGVSIIGMGGKK